MRVAGSASAYGGYYWRFAQAERGRTPLPMQALAALARGRAAFSGLEPDACFRQLISFPAWKRRYYKIGVIISRRV